MKFIRLLLFGILFCHNLELIAEPPTDFEAAEKKFHAALYHEAIPTYRAILQEIDLQNQSIFHLRLLGRLGLVHYLIDDYSSAYKYFSEFYKSLDLHLSNENVKEFDEYLYYFALTCRHLKLYPQAIQVLKEGNSTGKKNQIDFELALNDYMLGNLTSAKEQFLKLDTLSIGLIASRDFGSYQPDAIRDRIAPQMSPENTQEQESTLYSLIQFYLTRISMSEQDFSGAYYRINHLEPLISPSEPLFFEFAFLKGKVTFNLGDFVSSIQYLQLAIPKHHADKAEWVPEALYYLGWSHLKLADRALNLSEEQRHHFGQAEAVFSKLNSSTLKLQEFYHLSLAKCFLLKGRRLEDNEALEKAALLLNDADKIISSEAKALALLLRAQLLMETKQSYSSQQPKLSALFLESAQEFERIYNSLQSLDQQEATQAFKYQILAYQFSGVPENLDVALSRMKIFLDEQENLNGMLMESDRLQEFLYIYSAIACSLAEKVKEQVLVSQAEKILCKAINDFPDGKFSEESLNLLAIFYLRTEQFLKAETLFIVLADKFPNSSYADQALHWAAYCAEKLNKSEAISQLYRKRLFESYPHSPLSPLAYFRYYSYRQYLQGDRLALKHLVAFKDKFHEHPLQITAHYLVGIDYKHERRSAEGRSIRKKNLTKAINAFSQAEMLFNTLFQKKKIPLDQLEYYVMIYYSTLLERAAANQAIAEDSHTAKRAIYLQYARELLLQASHDFSDEGHPFASILKIREPFPKVQQEALYLLIENYIKSEDFKAAAHAIKISLAKYAKYEITQGSFLSRTFNERGKIAMQNKEFEKALEAFDKAEQANQGGALSIDQKLDLWIQQSLCYSAINQTDQAMLILSKVINDNTISSLRVKAMYLRAEIYQQQGRHELARKQLGATAKKGGEWAMKAKQKLEEEYGF